MRTNERAVQRPARGRARAVGIALFVGACGGTVGKAPSLGSESHFLAYCDTACDAGLECIGGICTRSCLTDSSGCSEFGGGAARCTNQSVEPGQVAVCDVSCVQSSECAALGAGYACEGSYCRSRAILDPPLSTDPGSSGGSGGSGATSFEADSAVCETFRDPSPPPDVRAITIVNTGSVPLYIQPVRPDCADPSDLVQVERDGQAVNLNPRAPQAGGGQTCYSCQDVIDTGWSEPHRLCPNDQCGRPAPVLIEPGQTLQQSARLEVVARLLPSVCAVGITSATIECYARVIPQPGNYTLTVRAALTLDCDRPGTDCDCRPDATGTCTNRSVSIAAAPLVFSSPSAWYFQNQGLSISAPGD